MIKCLSLLKRHSLFAGLTFLVFSCTIFTDHNAEDEAKVACLRSKEISKDQEQKIRASINADHKNLVLDTIFQKKHDSGKFSGCVLVAEKGVVLFKKSYGMACVNSAKDDSLTIQHK